MWLRPLLMPPVFFSTKHDVIQYILLYSHIFFFPTRFSTYLLGPLVLKHLDYQGRSTRCCLQLPRPFLKPNSADFSLAIQKHFPCGTLQFYLLLKNHFCLFSVFHKLNEIQSDSIYCSTKVCSTYTYCAWVDCLLGEGRENILLLFIIA